ANGSARLLCIEQGRPCGLRTLANQCAPFASSGEETVIIGKPHGVGCEVEAGLFIQGYLLFLPAHFHSAVRYAFDAGLALWQQWQAPIRCGQQGGLHFPRETCVYGDVEGRTAELLLAVLSFAAPRCPQWRARHAEVLVHRALVVVVSACIDLCGHSSGTQDDSRENGGPAPAVIEGKKIVMRAVGRLPDGHQARFVPSEQKRVADRIGWDFCRDLNKL